jgi:hypothetical protein
LTGDSINIRSVRVWSRLMFGPGLAKWRAKAELCASSLK